MAELNWYKGNIHTHTTESDGDASPEKVVRWFRQHGYDFLVLSDHNHLTLLDYGQKRGRRRRPLMVPGEEVSARILEGAVPVHLNGIGITRVVEPIDAGDVVSTIQANVNAIADASGITSINHPNYQWAFDHEEIKQVTGASLLEVFNGHPATNSFGGPGKFSGEQIWDGVLTAGRVIFGVATDDSHRYYDFHPHESNPGRGWVVVRAAELTKEAVVEALETGQFYASTGVMLEEVELSEKLCSLQIEQERDMVYATKFTGPDGVVHAEADGLEPTYAAPRRRGLHSGYRDKFRWLQGVDTAGVY